MNDVKKPRWKIYIITHSVVFCIGCLFCLWINTRRRAPESDISGIVDRIERIERDRQRAYESARTAEYNNKYIGEYFSRERDRIDRERESLSNLRASDNRSIELLRDSGDRYSRIEALCREGISITGTESP